MTLRGCAEPLVSAYDVGLLDLDGVVYVGDTVVEHAAETITAVGDRGWRIAYVTNNALRTPAQVADKLRGFGVDAAADEIVTSAQAAARVLAARLPAGARVLVAGGEGLREALRGCGLRPVDSADEGPEGVVCGHDPTHTWARLAEATLAIRAGLPWVASNTDVTIPDRRGKLPGAGAIVAMLSAASERGPDEIAGKPHPALHAESIERTGATRPLVVGDRLDTDIAGADAARVDSLLVLSGVTGPSELLAAGPGERPSYLAADLRGLLRPHPEVVTGAGGGVTVGRASARSAPEGLVVTGDHGSDGLDRLRAACVARWALPAVDVRVIGLD